MYVHNILAFPSCCCLSLSLWTNVLQCSIGTILLFNPYQNKNSFISISTIFFCTADLTHQQYHTTLQYIFLSNFHLCMFFYYLLIYFSHSSSSSVAPSFPSSSIPSKKPTTYSTWITSLGRFFRYGRWFVVFVLQVRFLTFNDYNRSNLFLLNEIVYKASIYIWLAFTLYISNLVFISLFCYLTVEKVAVWIFCLLIIYSLCRSCCVLYIHENYILLLF